MQTKGGSFTGDDKDFLKVRLGSNQVIPAFEEALKGMKVGGIRRIIVPEVSSCALGDVAMKCGATQCLDRCSTLAPHQLLKWSVCRRSATQTTLLIPWDRSRPTSRCVCSGFMDSLCQILEFALQFPSGYKLATFLSILQGRRALDFVLKNQVREMPLLVSCDHASIETRVSGGTCMFPWQLIVLCMHVRRGWLTRRCCLTSSTCSVHFAMPISTCNGRPIFLSVQH